MRTIVLLLAITLYGCTGGAQKPPADVLSKEQFTTVLLEAQVIEARVNHELAVEHRGEVPTAQYYADMFAEQGTTEEQFKATFNYYSDHPQMLKDIYEEIITRLSKQKDEVAP